MASLGGGVNDNVFLQNSEEEDDLFYRFKPYLDYEKSIFRPDNVFHITYEGDFYRFRDFSSEDTDNHYFTVSLDMNFREYYLKFLNRYVDKSDVDELFFTERIQRNINEPLLLLGVDFNRLAVELELRSISRRYEGNNYDIYNHDRNSFAGNVILHAFPKTDLFFQLDTMDFEYTESPRDGEYLQYLLGVRGRLTSKIEGTVSAGYQDREYSVGDQRFDNAVVETDVQFRFSEKVKLILKYVLTANESIINEYNYYEIDRFSLDISMESYRGFLLETGVFLEKDTFPESVENNRVDDFDHFYIASGYRFQKWLETSIRWEYFKRNSNYDRYDYEQNILTFFATVTL
jgi:hypothetical protein